MAHRLKPAPGGVSRLARRAAFLSTTALLAACPAVFADVKLASVFGDGMVLQRDRPVVVWGTAKPNSTVNVAYGPAKASGKADGSGKFKVTLPARPAGGPFTLQADDGGGAKTLSDVYSGDVWICSGQSNMQMSLGEADNGPATAAKAGSNARLRLCKIGQAWEAEPRTECKAEWKTATPETAAKFSAVGYFFGNTLLQSPELDDVPLGLIEAVLGGTMAEAWTPKEELATIEGKAENSMFGIGPTTLYNGMIHPMGPLGVKGVVWYQGEGNSGQPQTYASKLTALIRGWRKQFDNPKLPFLVVQLPDYAPSWGGYYWQWQRDAQQQVADKVPDVRVVNAIQTNDGLDLHPKPKQAIGERAALLARQEIYGERITGHGPAYKSADPQGDGIRVSFDTAGSTLAAADPKDVRGFMVAGEDGKFRRAKAVIDGDAVKLTSDLVAAPKFVRYAWAGVPDASLTNAEGMPASPFRTDTLPPDTRGTQPMVASRVLTSKDCDITVTDGRITGFTVKGKQFLSNETGLGMGVNMPSFFGPNGFGEFREIGPDLIQLGGEGMNLRIEVDAKGSTWTIRSKEKDDRNVRFNLSPVVKASDAGNGRATLTRPGAAMAVSGIEKVDNNDGLPFVEIKAKGNATTTVRFDFDAD